MAQKYPSEEMLGNYKNQEVCFVDVKTASQIIGVKPKTLYSWTSQRKIPHYRANGKLLFNAKEIIDFVKEGRINIYKSKNEAKIIVGNTMGFRNNSLDSGQVVSRARRDDV